MEKQSEKRCPYCGELIQAEAQKCKYCKEWLTGDKAITPTDNDNTQFGRAERPSAPFICETESNVFLHKVKKNVIDFIKKDFVEAVTETIFEVVGMFLILNAFFYDADLTSSPAMKYSKADTWLLDIDSYNLLFGITNIVTFVLLALITKRISSLMKLYAISGKYAVNNAYRFSSIVLFSIATMHLINFLIYQIDYEWILLDILSFAGLVVTAVCLMATGAKILKNKLTTLGRISIFSGVVFLVDAIEYLLNFAGGSFVPNYEITVSASIMFLEMSVVFCYGQYKVKTKTEKILSSNN